MNQEIMDFFAEHKIPLAKMVAVGVARRGLTETAINKAAEIIYNDVMNGKEIRPIRLAWEVFSRAKSLRGYELQEDTRKAERIVELERDLKEKDKLLSRVSELEEELKKEKALPWYRKLIRRTS